MTAAPKETKYVSNIGYLGEPVYTYSLKQGIEDGFLAPYKVIRINIDKDIEGWRPPLGMTDDLGHDIPDREYNQIDMDRILVLNKRTRLVARRVMEYLKATDPYAKTIIFCEDVDHADRMRAAIVNEARLLAIEHPKYVMRITGDSKEGKAELDNFIDPESKFPVIATTSELLTTGVDARTCKLIVIDKTINSMTLFKQIIGRGTRILEEYNKFFFTIMDFKGATKLFNDPDFDGEPIVIYEPQTVLLASQLNLARYGQASAPACAQSGHHAPLLWRFHRVGARAVCRSRIRR
jgi:type I restriction enzyme R subunit